MMEMEKENGAILLSFDEVPEWYQDSNYIRHGYRPVSGSAKVSFNSWMFMHNETINIYSHLLPAVAFVLGEWYLLQHLHDHYPAITTTDYAVFFIYLLTAAICLGLSTIYHTMINHSLRLHTTWLRMDFVGIVFLTVGVFISGVEMTFWCQPLERNIYWGMVGASSRRKSETHTVTW